MGWLHWSEEQLLTSDMNSIAVGYAGMRDLLSSVFGKGDGPAEPAPEPEPEPEQPAYPAEFSPISTPHPKPPLKKPPALTPAAFDKMFAGIKGKSH